MKTAQNVPRTGMAKAKGEHLNAANDEPKPAGMQLCYQSGWKYTPAVATDITQTWRRFGWTPSARRAA